MKNSEISNDVPKPRKAKAYATPAPGLLPN